MRQLFFMVMLLWSVVSSAREWTDLRSFGNISTSTMYVFTSPNCPHCRVFHKTIFPELTKRYVQTGQAQIVIVDMPYDRNALRAVMLMRCLPEEKSTKLMGWLYENQDKWSDSHDASLIFAQYAQVLGMYQPEFQACLSDEALKDAIEQQRDSLSALYNVRGWPTVILRQGNSVESYVGADKRAILSQIDRDIKHFQEAEALQARQNK